MVRVADVMAVMVPVAVSVPVMVSVYEPLAAFVVVAVAGVLELEEPQPLIPKPTAVMRQRAT